MVRSYLASRAVGNPTPPERIDAMARDAWHVRGLALLDPKEIHNPFERQVVINLANKRYGKRKEKR